MFLITSDQSEPNRTFSAACFQEQVKEKSRKTIMSQHREGERATETERASLSGLRGGCRSPRLTNQSAAVRSSACGSLPLNGMTEVELKNGYGNTDLIRVAGGASENEGGVRVNSWCFVPLVFFKFNMKYLMSCLKITKRAIVLFVRPLKCFVVCLCM